MKVENILIVTSIPIKNFGGSIISASQIANAFQQNGFQTFLMTDNRFPIFENTSFSLLHDEYSENKLSGYISRGKKILKIIKDLKIDYIICMDKVSCYHASLPACIKNVPLLPIIPGGGKDAIKFPPLKVEKTVVFSKEVKFYLIDNFNFNDLNIIVKYNRVHFDSKFRKDKRNISNKFRIAYISRAHITKFSSFKFFLDEINLLKDYLNLEINFIGDGDDLMTFKDVVGNCGFNKIIGFLGFKKIDFFLLDEYDLVVTMGRGIVESLGMCIPVAVCGENGYKGVVTKTNIDQFISTNFTGRSIEQFSSLREDIQYVSNYDLKSLFQLSKEVRFNFDVLKLPFQIKSFFEEFNLIPGNGSLIKTILMNLRVFLKF